jgi:hypothetical protein
VLNIRIAKTKSFMKTNPPVKLAFIIICMALLPARASLADEAPNAPAVFNASIGGLFGTSYLVAETNGVLFYSAYKGGKECGSAKIIPTDVQWREFREILDKINIWQWNTNYINHRVLDGTRWALEMKYSDRSFKTFGSNCYPQTGGKPNNSPEYTEEFRNYLKAVEKLLGGKTFE